MFITFLFQGQPVFSSRMRKIGVSPCTNDKIQTLKDFNELKIIGTDISSLLQIQKTQRIRNVKPLLSRFSRGVMRLHTLWPPHQAPLSMGLSRQEYWSVLPCPPPGDLPDPGIKPRSFASPALAGGFFYHQCHLGLRKDYQSYHRY